MDRKPGELSEQEAAKRRDEALRRALGTKHVPHKPPSKDPKKRPGK